jgi:hypothetical protein
LIGARRPTVTLALGQLADRGSLIKQGDEWLILEAPPSSPADSTLQARHVRLTNGSRPQWRPELPAPKPTRRLEEESQLLLEKLTQLHLDTDQNRQLARRLTADMRTLRDQRLAIVNDIAARRANESQRQTHPPLATAIST